MTTLTDTQVITASGGLVELGYVERTTSQSITATTFAGASEVFATDLTFVADGGPVLVEFYCPQVSVGGSYIVINLSNGGSTDMGQISYNGVSAAVNTQYRYTPSAGAQTLNVRAWVQSGTGTVSSGAGGSGQYPPTFLRVSKIVQATQWPAVTTGTIICTSSTRPASPFEGQEIYETDTNKKYMWNGSSWLWTWGEQVGRRLAYQQQTSPYTVSSATLAGAANIFASNLSWTADGTSAYRIKFFTPIEISTTTATEHINYSMVDASGNSLGLVAQGGEGGGDHRNRNPANIEFFYTPSAGTATVNMRAHYSGATGAQVYAGGGGSNNWIPMWMAVYGPDLT